MANLLDPNCWQIIKDEEVKEEAQDLHFSVVELLRAVYEQCETVYHNPYEQEEAAELQPSDWHPPYRLSFLPSDEKTCLVQVGEYTNEMNPFSTLAFSIICGNGKYKRFGRSWHLEPEGSYKSQLSVLTEWAHDRWARLAQPDEGSDPHAGDDEEGAAAHAAGEPDVHDSQQPAAGDAVGLDAGAPVPVYVSRRKRKPAPRAAEPEEPEERGRRARGATMAWDGHADGATATGLRDSSRL